MQYQFGERKSYRSCGWRRCWHAARVPRHALRRRVVPRAPVASLSAPMLGGATRAGDAPVRIDDAWGGVEVGRRRIARSRGRHIAFLLPLPNHERDHQSPEQIERRDLARRNRGDGNFRPLPAFGWGWAEGSIRWGRQSWGSVAEQPWPMSEVVKRRCREWEACES